jgi:hypothetical protein
VKWTIEKYIKEQRHVYTCMSTPINLGLAYCSDAKEKQILKEFENKVLRRMFRPGREHVTGSWREAHNDEYNNLHSSPNLIRGIM